MAGDAGESGSKTDLRHRNKKSLAAEDSKLVETLKADQMPHASSSASQSVNPPTICIVSGASARRSDRAGGEQRAKSYVEHYIQGDPDLAKLPVLSAPHRLKLVVAKMTRQAMWRWKRPVDFP